MTKRFFPSFARRVVRGILSGFVGLTVAGAAASAQMPATVKPTPQIKLAIDENQLTTLPGALSPLAAHAQDEGLAPDNLPIGRAMLMLRRTTAQQAALDKLVDEQQNTKSSSYHHWLTPDQFGQQFGAAASDIQQLTAWLQKHGLTVEPPMAGRSLLVFSGTHAQMKSAFHTEFHSYKLNGVRYWSAATEPQIPAALAPAVIGFTSLNNFPRKALHTTPQIVHRESSAWQHVSAQKANAISSKTGTVVNGGPKSLFTTDQNGQTQTLYIVGPSDLATIYNIQPLWDAGIDGTGETIAIVSDTDIDPADVDSFRATFGLPATKLNLIYYGPNPGKNGDEGEADLDVQWAGAVAKNATIDLVVAANTAASGGIDGAAAYIINNNLAPLLNVSYGACEQLLGTGGNQYYSLIWEQAAAQGITVLTAAGDSGSDVCDDGYSYSTVGLSVSGVASTDYNVAVGGTDFASAYANPAQYWNATNDPTTLQSALSYIPESPWNNTCASPEVFNQLHVVDGLPDATPEAVCNDYNEQQAGLLDLVGGSGGASNCTTVDATSTTQPCSGGHPKPAWQSGVTGIPSDQVRDMPDVSLMAGNGLWNSAYVYCESDAIGEPCDVNNAIEAAGGTSFASPIFAGMLALVEQKTGTPLGNANYILYKLAASQFGNSSAAQACQAANVTAGNTCVFYDVTEGNNAGPCQAGTPDCTVSVPADRYGILSGYSAQPGYDLATGLGSVNVTNLVNGWSSASSSFLPSTTTIIATGSTTVSYGEPVNTQITVAAVAPASGTPSGDVGVTSNSTAPNSISISEGTLANGTVTIPALPLPVGSYQLFAHYAGDATFAPSDSTSGLSVTVSPAIITGQLTASSSTVLAGQYVTLSFALPGITGALAPTGAVTFVDNTNSTTLGSRLITTASDGITANASLTLSVALLKPGANVIVANYAGDPNFGPSASGTVTITLTVPFTASINPGTLTVTANDKGSVTVVATPIGKGGVLDPASLSFTCPATLPAGLACSFSTPVAGSNGTVSSTLSLQTSSPLLMKGTGTLASRTSPMKLFRGIEAASLVALLVFFLPKRRRRFSSLVVILLSVISFTTMFVGCASGNSGGGTKPLVSSATTLSVSSATLALGSPETLTAVVTGTSASSTPTGSVTFASGTGALGTGTLSNGTATYTTSTLPAGTQSITASYAGDSNFAASASAPSSLDVNFTTTLAITVSDQSSDTSTANVTLTVQ